MREPIRALSLGSFLLLAAQLAQLAGCGSSNQRWIHRIHFIGVKSISEKDLRSKLAMQETSWIPFAPKHYLDPFTLKTDEHRIISYYNDHGFFNARLLATNLQDRKHNSLDVEIRLSEGPPTHVEQVTVDGMAQVGAEGDKILATLKLKHGEVYNEQTYIDDKARLSGELQARGYAWVNVTGVVDINRDSRLATVKFTVVTGPHVTMGEVTVTGTKKVDPQEIVRQAGIVRGKPYKPQIIEDARGKLYNLGLFSTVRPDLVHEPGHPDVADVKLSVNETRLHELRLGVGLGLESQRTDVHITGIYTVHDFLGGLRTLRFTVQPGYAALPAFWNIEAQGPLLSAEASLTQPDVILRYTELKYTVGYDIGIEYGYQFHGPRTSLGLRWPVWHDRLHFGLSYNFQYILFFHVNPTLSNPNPGQQPILGTLDLNLLNNKDYRLGWWQEDLSLDLRNTPLDTTRGAYLGLSIEEGGEYAGGAFTYEKVVPEVRGYVPIGKRLVLAARVTYGHIFSQGSDGSPLTRRFYLGGPDSHRGFNYDRLSPELVACGQYETPADYKTRTGMTMPPNTPPACANPQVYSNSALLLPVGGDDMFLGQFETRVNIVRLFGFWLGAAAFLDVGDVTQGRVDFGNLHYATGGGLRYKTVVGTVRFDVGVRLNRLYGPEGDIQNNFTALNQAQGKLISTPDPGERFAYHISIGEAF